MGRPVNHNGVGQHTGPRAHVVVADDDLRESGVLSWLLRQRGYDVSAVPAGEPLVELLRGRPADLILLGGIARDLASDTLRKVRAEQNGRTVPVIVAGVTNEEDAEIVLQQGADDYLPKPLRVSDLLASIGAQLRSRDNIRQIRAELARREEELQRALDDIATTRQLVEILNEVTTDLTAAEIYRVLARRVARALDLRHCSVVLADVGDTHGTVVASFADASITNLEVRLDRYPEFVAALRTQRPVLVPDVMEDPMFADVRQLWRREGRTAPVRSVLTIPFSFDRKRGGIFFLRTERDDRVLTPDDAAFAEVVIRAAVTAIRRAQALDSSRADNRRLEELATTDSLTRLLNRRALLERLSAEVDRARRFRNQLSMLMVDVDYFKSINDQHGHLVGDEILRQLAMLLSSAARTVDVVARYGGEEFVMILPETATDGAVIVAERLRDTVRKHRFEIDANRIFHLTCSVGVATFPSPRVTSTDDLFARADEALYRAKSGGRNLVRT
jgi:two-component system, cell cycle response regulator